MQIKTAFGKKSIIRMNQQLNISYPAGGSRILDAEMEQILAATTGSGARYYIPTRAQLEAMKVGDQALDCWGRMAEVTEITARRLDINGKMFVCYYTKSGPASSCSMSVKEGELTRTAALSRLHKSAEVDLIERWMRIEMGLNPLTGAAR